jgi:hypothetical protein
MPVPELGKNSESARSKTLRECRMTGFSQIEATVIQTLNSISTKVEGLSNQLESVQDAISKLGVAKEWYSTSEVAEMKGVTRYTVQERWCNKGRIECEKDPNNIREWRIPGHEFERLRRGGRV